VRHGIAAVELRCAGAGRCDGTLELVARVKQNGAAKRHSRRGSRHVRDVVIGRADFSIAPGTSETVDVHLTKRGRTLLRQVGKRGLEVEVKGSGLQSAPLVLKVTARSRA
jgi:hypothetical protein